MRRRRRCRRGEGRAAGAEAGGAGTALGLARGQRRAGPPATLLARDRPGAPRRISVSGRRRRLNARPTQGRRLLRADPRPPRSASSSRGRVAAVLPVRGGVASKLPDSRGLGSLCTFLFKPISLARGRLCAHFFPSLPDFSRRARPQPKGRSPPLDLVGRGCEAKFPSSSPKPSYTPLPRSRRAGGSGLVSSVDAGPEPRAVAR